MGIVVSTFASDRARRILLQLPLLSPLLTLTLSRTAYNKRLSSIHAFNLVVATLKVLESLLIGVIARARQRTARHKRVPPGRARAARAHLLLRFL